METTERIVEAYVRYIKGCATIPNLRCAGQHEIDILAINPVTLDRYHIESSVSISKKFSILNDKEFSAERLRDRVQKHAQRRTVGYFLESKFAAQGVIETLSRYGFTEGNYQKVIVTWDATPGAASVAAANGVDEIGVVFLALARGRSRGLVLPHVRVVRVVVVDDVVTLRAVELIADRVARFLAVDAGFVGRDPVSHLESHHLLLAGDIELE